MFPWSKQCTEILKACNPEAEEEDEEEDEEQAGQEHVFTFYDELSPEEQRELDDEFDKINQQEMEEAWQHAEHASLAEQGIQTIPPILMNWELKRPPKLQPGANLTKLSQVTERKKGAWNTLGLEMYSKDRVAIVIMSGGKDSRIGGDVPKGLLDVGLLSHKSIFQLYVERIRRLQHLVQRKFKKAVFIPLYIMCNRENKEDVLFFTQGYFPIFDKHGKFLLSEKHRIAMNPNGNGGIFKALMEEGMVSDMKGRGVTCLFVCSIDNVLAKVGDPVFIGFCETCKAEAGLKTIEKVLPEEQYGIFCSQLHRDVFEDVDGDGKLDAVSKVKADVLEFFELPEELKKRRKQAGSSGMPLELSSGNLSQYFFKVDFVKRVSQQHWKKYHLIPKSVPYIDLKLGHKVEPPKQEKNARRLEVFIFDAFQASRSVVALQVPRSEYAVVKNVSGKDSPSMAVQALGELHQGWIIQAGGSFLGSKALAEALAPLPPPSQATYWDSTADYVASWSPAVDLEAAASAADEDDTRILCNVEITWGERRGSFAVPSGLASAHRMKLRGLVQGADGPTERSSGWLCLRRPGSGAGAGWSGHAGLIAAEVVCDDGTAQPLEVSVGEEDAQIPQTLSLRMTFKLIPGASDAAPKPGQRKSGYIVEFIPKSLPYSCMAVALAELSIASQLLREVILQARAPQRPKRLQAEGEWHADGGDVKLKGLDLKPWKLNPPQELAVRSALQEELSLIHGPPGTGKTTTASALCVLYALSNLDKGEVAAVLYCTPSNDAADVACLRVAVSSSQHFQALSQRRRQEVLAAGGTGDCAICFNTGCNAITACGHHFHRSCLEKAQAAGTRGCPLCRRPLRRPEGGLMALRVYSAEMERGDFPVPKRIDHPSAKPRKVRRVAEAMRPFALHWRCHGLAPGVEATQESLEAGMAYERMLQAGLDSPHFDELRMEYYLALSAARCAELKRADVVFATCISARRGGLSAALQAEGAPELLQVVLDEAGQAPEPEALCPMTLAKNAQKIVLVGDPKQLRPIILSPVAEQMGLNISLLERLSEAPWSEPKLLSLQYRMHEDLNAFPAAYFYGGRVRTDPGILARAPGRLAHPGRPSKPEALLFWSSPSAPEQISQVRTASSSAKSRFNPAEAVRAAELAKALAAKVGGQRVAILTWYNAQVQQLNEILEGTGVYVGGVVSSQGNEWDYVLLSTVRSTPGGLGALEDEHLLDVALTRARLGMCVLGTSETLRRITAWSCFLDHCEAKQLVTGSQPVVLGGDLR